MKLIDGDKLKEMLRIDAEPMTQYGIGVQTGYRYALSFIDNIPKIDAEPVRHGRMIEGRYPDDNKCSECGQIFRDDIGFIIQDDDGSFRYPKRCPECGCYWDGGDENAAD